MTLCQTESTVPLMAYDYRSDTLYRMQLRRLRRRDNMVRWAVSIIALAIGLAVILPACTGYFDEKQVTTVVLDKERVCSGTGSSIDCKYLVFTDFGTFELTDALFGTVRFNSSDVYGRIQPGREYVITYYGWRFGLFSMYPNIKELTPTGL